VTKSTRRHLEGSGALVVNRDAKGFTLVELMIVVAIVGILASTAVPNFLRFQLRAKSAEAKTNIAGIHTAEQAHHAEFGSYITAAPSPASYGGTNSAVFSDEGASGRNFKTVGWRPEGLVYFQYSVAVAGEAFLIEAAADIDGNGAPQVWAVIQPDSAGNLAVNVLGCTGVWDHQSGSPGLLHTIGPCGAAYGRSEF